MRNVRRSERGKTQDGSTRLGTPTWDRLGARIRAEALLAATLDLAGRGGARWLPSWTPPASEAAS